jgi:DEAD/DEAH box helicase domain-containing protein
MSINELLSDLRGDDRFMANVVAWRTLHAQDARYAPLPATLHPALRQALTRRGIKQAYTHQAAAVGHALDGDNVAVVTPTASGKTLCYNLPVLHSLLSDPAARALYLFPTKALAQDQLAELGEFVTALAIDESVEWGPSAIVTYDGDTPSARRAQLRQSSRILLTNPDMLHVGILPYHPQWAEFMGGLRYVVIDEMHTYRGVFGSHMANVLRRLRRLCALYGATPQFICTSATIANPQQLAEGLIEAPVALVDDNGAPRGEKHIILYNPPVYDAEHGLRRASTLEAQELAARCVLAGVQTIVFGRARSPTFATVSNAPNPQSEIPNPKSAATVAAICRQNGAQSKRVCAAATSGPSSLPMHLNWGLTSASCRRPCFVAIPAASPARGSRWAVPGVRRRARWPCSWPPAARWTST